MFYKYYTNIIDIMDYLSVNEVISVAFCGINVVVVMWKDEYIWKKYGIKIFDNIIEILLI